MTFVGVIRRIAETQTTYMTDELKSCLSSIGKMAGGNYRQNARLSTPANSNDKCRYGFTKVLELLPDSSALYSLRV